MKKVLFILGVFVTSFTVNAQDLDIGIMFAPNLSVNRVDGMDKDGKINDYLVDKNGSGLRFAAGPVIDIFLTDNIAVHSGVLFTIKRASLTFEKDSLNQTTFDPVVNLQYVQIPVSIKLYTNEIMSRTQLYFSLGGTLDTKIAENLANDQPVDFEEEFGKLFDAGLYMGIGVEKGIGSSNKLFGEITYNRGLINAITKDFHDTVNRTNDLTVNNDLFSLVVGFKF